MAMITRTHSLFAAIACVVVLATISFCLYHSVIRYKPKQLHFIHIKGERGASLTASVVVRKLKYEQGYSKDVICKLYSGDHHVVVADTTDYSLYLGSMERHGKIFFEVAANKSQYVKRGGGIEMPFPDAIGIQSDYLNSSTTPGIVKELELKISERISLWCKINDQGSNELFIMVEGVPFERVRDNDNSFPYSAMITAAMEFCNRYK